ncbi:MAG: S41 family peptidase [Huintestinicola sp.]|uniref:S41 family peptidase n=1 Tax=Huintestinicola sp. TaxID=2981661 RepID=UPI003F042BC6
MKKLRKILTICGAVFAVISMFLTAAATLLFYVPVQLMIAAAVLSVFSLAGAAVTSEKKKIPVIRSSVTAALLCLGIVFGYFCNPYANSVSLRSSGSTMNAKDIISKEAAEADIKEAFAHLKKVHPMFKDSVPQAAESAYVNALSSIPADGLTCAELRRSIESILSTLGDAHTSVGPCPAEERYPVDYAELVKGRSLRITEINGEPLQSFFDAHKELFSYEAESWALEQLRSNLISDTGLEYLGLGTDVTLTYENENERVERQYTDGDFISYAEYMERNAAYYDRNENFVHYELYPDENYALLTLNSCNYNNEYCEALKNMFTEISQKGIEHVIVDLRRNGGGSDQVAWEFISYLGTDSFTTLTYEQRLGFLTLKSNTSEWKTDKRTPVFAGDVTILTSTESFSSAMLFALYIKDNSLGTIVGEIPGNSANGYGDIATFSLKNSGLIMSVSTKKFSRAIADAGDYVIPDTECSKGDALEIAVSLFSE